MKPDSVWRVAIALMLTGGLLTVTRASGQDSSRFLLDLPSELVAVRYSPGSLDRAVQLQDSFEEMVEDFRGSTKTKVGLVLLLLSRDEWKESNLSRPYGLAEPSGGRGLAMPAWGDEGTVTLWQKLLGTRLPTLSDQPLRGTPEQSASLAVSDLMGSLDAARILLRAAGVSGDQPWVDSVLAHAVVLDTMQEHHKDRLSDVRLVFADLSTAGGGAGAYPLAAATRPPSLAATMWFESQFYVAANLLVGPDGSFSLKSMLKQARKNGGRISAAELVAKCPELAGWQHSSFAVN